MYPHENWDYHDYRDSHIKNYIPAMEELVRRGYWVLRMGSVVKEPLDIKNPRIIDYACSQERTEFMDLYIYAHCHFAVGVFSGPIDLANSLGKPVAAVNTVPLLGGMSHGYRNTIISPKLLFNESNGRLMTLNEIIDSNCLNYCYSNEFKEDGIKLIENESDMITQLAIEVADRTNGIWRETKIQQNIQKKFWEILTNRVKLNRLKGWPEINELDNFKSRTILWKMGAYFLKKHQDLIQ
jgi:putative glycosyltransferase (TIGR04372 family)